MDSSVDLRELAGEWGALNAQQMLLLAAGLRPACRLRVRREKLPALAATARRLSVKMVVGFDAVVPERTAGRCGFSEWSRRAGLSPRGLGASSYVYLCAEHAYGQRLRRCDETGDDLAVGELLGYPACCVRAFGERFGAARGGDPVLAMYADARPIAWPMNVSLLCFGRALLSHVPCAPNCGPSRASAEGFYDFIAGRWPDSAAAVRRSLSSWVLHTESMGVAAFAAAARDGGVEVTDVSEVDGESVLGRLVGRGALITREACGLAVDGFHLPRGAKLFEFV